MENAGIENIHVSQLSVYCYQVGDDYAAMIVARIIFFVDSAANYLTSLQCFDFC